MKEHERQDNDRKLEAWLARAPRLPASREFTASVMHALTQRRPSWREHLRAFLFRSHQLHWNVAGFAATASLMLAVSLGLWWHVPPGESPDAETTTVRFEVYEPLAREVMLAGDFSQWQARIPLRQLPDGRWVTEIRLSPGTYEYAFVVNGSRWIQDPRAPAFRDDGFGNRNAVRTVM